MASIENSVYYHPEVGVVGPNKDRKKRQMVLDLIAKCNKKMSTYKMIYLAKANSVIAQKGEMFEIDDLHASITSKRSGMSVPMQMIREFDKNFMMFSDAKTFRCDGKSTIVVGKGVISFNGTIKSVEVVRYIANDLETSAATIESLSLFGVSMTFKTLQDVLEYADLVTPKTTPLYFTLGPNYKHKVLNNEGKFVQWDHNSVLVVNVPEWDDARSLIVRMFADKWSHMYSDMSDEDMKLFPGGKIVVDTDWMRRSQPLIYF